MLEAEGRDRKQGLRPGQYQIAAVDAPRRIVKLRDAKGSVVQFHPSKMRSAKGADQLALFEEKQIDIHSGDRIRWTKNDHRRGLFNADQAKIIDINNTHVSLVTSAGLEHRLKRSDPMLKRLDLAYALNAHMAQGLTSDHGIAVMDSREKNLANQQTFLVTITRLRDSLTLFVDNASKLSSVVAHNPGTKTSALEVTERLRLAAATGLKAGKPAQEKPLGKDKPEIAKDMVKPFEIGI